MCMYWVLFRILGFGRGELQSRCLRGGGVLHITTSGILGHAPTRFFGFLIDALRLILRHFGCTSSQF